MTDLSRLITVQGEPFGSTSMYAQWRVFGAAREAGIKVMLDGQGADELLGGYAYYRYAQISSLLREGHWGKALELTRYTAGLPSAGFWSVVSATANSFIPAALKKPARRLLKKDIAPAWLNGSWFAERDVDATGLNCVERNADLRHVLHHTLTTTSLPQLLRYEDRNSMAFSIESRVPFMTSDLAQFLLALTGDHIIASDGTTKRVFRRAMRGIVPDAILDRRDKKGFPTPEKHWLFSLRDYVGSVLNSEAGHEVRAFNIEEIQREWNNMSQDSKELESRLWRWVNLILWVEKSGVNMG
jgi:asparagine synthase (glutamine-hydrolysing)